MEKKEFYAFFFSTNLAKKGARSQNSQDGAAANDFDRTARNNAPVMLLLNHINIYKQWLLVDIQ
jgi:hypothetical protein